NSLVFDATWAGFGRDFVKVSVGPLCCSGFVTCGADGMDGGAAGLDGVAVVPVGELAGPRLVCGKAAEAANRSSNGTSTQVRVRAGKVLSVLILKIIHQTSKCNTCNKLTDATGCARVAFSASGYILRCHVCEGGAVIQGWGPATHPAVLTSFILLMFDPSQISTEHEDYRHAWGERGRYRRDHLVYLPKIQVPASALTFFWRVL